jgi:hypothetical protein
VNLKQKFHDWCFGSPVDLAIFRITVSIVILLSSDVWTASSWASSIQVPPPGWNFISSLIPPTLFKAQCATAILVGSAIFTLIGLFTRISSICAALSAVWLLGVPQHSGQVMHTHHLVWFLFLIASAPSGDALSVDVWWKKRTGKLWKTQSNVSYGIPIRAAWISIGLIFFFPGIWKLKNALHWLNSLPALIEWKWFQLGIDPFFTLSATAIWYAGFVAILFEVTFVFLIFNSKTRTFGAFLAFVFHQAIWLVMGIAFSSLWLCYTVFIPWHRWIKTAAPKIPKIDAPLVPLIVSGALLSAQLVTGILKLENCWPVACYPTFTTGAPAVVSWLEVEEVGVQTTKTFSLENLRTRNAQRLWGVMTQALMDGTAEQLKQFYLPWRGEIPNDVKVIHFYIVKKKLGTDEHSTRQLLATVPHGI